MREDSMSKTIALLAATFVCLLPDSMAAIRAQQTPSHPDFTGVYYPFNPNAAVRPTGAAAPPRPVAVIDGRDGRPATAPKLTAEYLAKWEVLRKSRMSGSSATDPNANCLSAGMPSMMGMGYGMEIQHTKDKITIYGELNDVYRRIFLDGRKASQKTIDDPTFAGYSTGHWEGDTLVVDTVAVREDTLLDLFSPHSDQMTVGERIRFTSPGTLEDRVTTMDPKALLEPFVLVRTYRKASPPNDELREFSCAEGLASAK
jgi:hypothetical protein